MICLACAIFVFGSAQVIAAFLDCSFSAIKLSAAGLLCEHRARGEVSSAALAGTPINILARWE
ncbi:hypothetical protein [Microcoleus sp. FACHB-672]|uniref:hypothetical protein n=1 Tax=Microcoleus sp. FACHB-672 TaxID=2692825 RepID=UPI001689EC8B|nr:hypothetical protein [Microcoleus sp. FACHB-672]MBD2040766.1 hypothetical protein [Microcoleus sp. FACHB-672]